MNKISEKAVWDELVPSGDENTSSASFGQSAQPQMMFCYKCSQVIPANSAFCPWCQTELFVTCPKCANKYSSQYPSCNQCGTNREMYMAEIQRVQKQKEEAERKKEEIRLAKELAEEKEIQARQEIIRLVNEEIENTAEYKEAYKFLLNAKIKLQQNLGEINRRHYISSVGVTILTTFMSALCFAVLVGVIGEELFKVWLWGSPLFFIVAAISGIVSFICCLSDSTMWKKSTLDDLKPNGLYRSYLSSAQISSNIEKLIFNQIMLINGFGWDDAKLEQWLIKSYRNVYGIALDSVPYEWLSEKPTFSSCHIDFSHWIKNNIKYPSEAKKKWIEGEVIVNYTVNRFGFVENVNIRKSAHPLLDSEVVRVVSESPQWSPGRFKGIAVSVKFQHVYTFKI